MFLHFGVVLGSIAEEPQPKLAALHTSCGILQIYQADCSAAGCRFFSSLIQRSAQVHRRLKGGSMTMLAILPGQPATGERQPAAAAQDYSNLTPAQRDKLLAALALRQPPKAEVPPGCVKTEVLPSSLQPQLSRCLLSIGVGFSPSIAV